MKKQFDEYIKALNQHDIEKVLGFLADDFELYFVEFDSSMDKKAYVDVLGWDKGVNGKVTYENLEIEGNTIKGLFTERNQFFDLVDITEMKATITYRFNENGKIVKQSYTALPDQPAFQEKMQPVIEWARAHMPNELEEIYPQNQMIYNEEMGKRWVALLKKWKAAKNK